ncbi:hypothetical protein HYALB_00013419 [Hymenoscyphus albidus]|uniref:Uncharacterized protein n=1 Tax=Hymenoscyphus albidus TaxID=595503 RepID=A0A9N9LYQ2_9HELO|nr:hypothetical protein HYALB_00013419 [Hymenoscyphus albidus]
MSGVINKAKEVIPGAHPTHTTGTHTTGTHTGTTEGLAGHHNSRAANAADPRIDSDLDGSRNLGAAHNTIHTTGGGLPGTSHTGGGLTGHNTTGGGLTGTSHNTTTGGSGLTGHSNAKPNTTGLTGAGHSTNTTAGPHKSDLLNKADPRIDSDLSKTGGHAHTIGAQDKHNNAGGTFGTHNTPSTHTGTTHNTHTTGSGLTGTTHNTHTTGGLTGSTGHSTNAGPHSSNLANKADPKVDSDLDGRATHGGVAGTVASHVKPGPAPNTAGPHKSDLLNKLDPRVDSNLDGSKTVGGNKTYAETYAHKDSYDASQVPPSVFAAHHGSPEILHGDHAHDRAGRHGSLSHQEQYRGI